MRASRLCSRTPASRASSTYYGIVGVVALFAILPGSVFAGKSDFPPLLASFTPESQCVDNVIFMDELLCSMPAPRNGALNPCAAACKLLRGAPDGICVRRPRCNKKIRIFGEPSVAAGGTRATRVARSPKKGKGKGCKKRSPRSASENYDYETCEIYDDEYSGECVVGSSEEYSGEYVEGSSESAENSGECVEGSDSDSGERSGSLETGTTAKPPVKPTSNPPAKPSAQPPVKPSPNPPMKPTPNPPAKPSAQPPVKPGKPGCGVGDGNANLPGGGNRKGKGEENGNENLAGHRSGESFSYGDSYSEGDSGSDTEERVIRAPYMCMCLCPP